MVKILRTWVLGPRTIPSRQRRLNRTQLSFSVQAEEGQLQEKVGIPSHQSWVEYTLRLQRGCGVTPPERPGRRASFSTVVEVTDLASRELKNNLRGPGRRGKE